MSGRSSNTKGVDNIISNGSVIAVADGQCMLIVEQGKVVEVCAEPGEFVYDTSTEPSIFTGGLNAEKINRHSPYLSITLHKCYPYYLFGISTFPSSVYHSIALRKFSITIV